jgi:predicted RNA-binding protein with PUA-like domain
MAFWLMKSEPDAFSILDFKKKGKACWDGVRNYTARNYLRDQIKLGDEAFFYHSSCPEPGIAGTMRVTREGHPDPSQFDSKSKYFDPKALPTAPRWYQVELEFQSSAKTLLPLGILRENPALRNMAMFKYNRLSVSPVAEAHWKLIMKLQGYWR